MERCSQIQHCTEDLVMISSHIFGGMYVYQLSPNHGSQSIYTVVWYIVYTLTIEEP